jgi:hypothetical protein
VTKYLPHLWIVATIGLYFSGIVPLGGAGMTLLFLSGVAALFFIFIMNAVEKSLLVRGYKSGDWPLLEETTTRVKEFEELGFEKLEILQLDMSPTATLVALTHSEHNLYATVFTLAHDPPVSSFDIVSVDPEKWVGLTTGPKDDGCALPAAVGQFRQAFEGADPAELFENHLKGLESLKEEGFVFALVDMPFIDFMRAGMSKSSDKFHDSPLLCTAIALYRTITKDHPHKGFLAHQKIYKKQLEQVRNTKRRARHRLGQKP